MNSRNIILIIVTLAVVYGAWQVSKTNAPTVELSNETLYPTLIDQVNDINNILIRSADDATELKRVGDNWVISNRDNFPAKFDAVKSTLLKIAEVTVIEKKTAVAEKYATLGVNDPTSANGTGVRVDIHNSSNEQLVSLIIGNERQGRALGEANYYIRRVDDAASYLASGDLDISAQVDDWLEPNIVDIDTERVRQITITPDGEDPVIIQKAKPTDNFFTVANIPAGFKAKSRATVSSLGALLLSLRFEDVISASKVSSSTPRGTVEALTFDGLTANLERYDYQDNEYVKMSFSFDENNVVAESLDSSEKTEDADESTRQSVAEEVTALNAKTGSWLYKLPDFKMRMLDKRLSDLIEPVEEEEEESDSSTADPE
ncbi:MAG: DUF4340 domain-containing protein [Gammaproteobacteria bacterium]